jgi:hypothetical protein
MPSAPQQVALAEESVYNLIPPSQQKRSKTMGGSINAAGATVGPLTGAAKNAANHRAAANLPPSYSTFGLQGTSKVAGNVAGRALGEDPEPHPAVKSTGGMGRPVGQDVDPNNFLKRSTAATVKVAGNAGAGGCHNNTRSASTNNNNKRSLMIGSAGGSGEDQNNNNNNSPQRINQKLRPEVPVRTEKPLMGLNSGKNFVSDNAKEVSGAVPKQQPEAQRAVDLPDFGKVPQYLRTIKSGIEQEKATAKSHAVAVATAVDYDELSPAEVAELRGGLQRRLDDLSKAIKSLPFKLETRSQIRRKEVLEQDFAAVEAAMAKLSRKRILVMHD